MNIIKKEEADKAVLEKNLRCLQERLSQLNNNLLQHRNLYDNYDRTIKETESGFKKVWKNIEKTKLYCLFIADIGEFTDLTKLSTARSTQTRKQRQQVHRI